MKQVIAIWPKFKEWARAQEKMRGKKRARDPLAE
jgi:hypothetical protein